MKEIQITQMQMEDSVAAMDAAISKAFSASDREKKLYVPDEIQVPRPDFAVFSLRLAEAAEVAGKSAPGQYSGRFAVAPKEAAILHGFAGLRGVARAQLQTKNGMQTISGPAIVLEDGRHVALLTAEQPSGRISPMQHALLEAEYAKQQANVQAEHQSQDATNAGEIGPALVAASSTASANAHRDMHGLAAQTRTQTFGTNFSKEGRQDIRLGHEVRSVRSAVVAADRVVLYIGAHDQLPAEKRLLGVNLNSDGLAVGLTLAATESRGDRPDLAANLANMTEI